MYSESQKVPAGVETSIDALCHVFQQKLEYKIGQKDMIAMKHTFEIEYPDGRKQKKESMLLNRGLQNDNDKKWDDSDSAMNRTVGLPLACAVRGILEGRITRTGVCRPTTKDIYGPILNEMELMGVVFEERTFDL